MSLIPGSEEVRHLEHSSRAVAPERASSDDPGNGGSESAATCCAKGRKQKLRVRFEISVCGECESRFSRLGPYRPEAVRKDGVEIIR